MPDDAAHPGRIALSDLLARTGEEVACSPWRSVGQSDIDAFADLTDDRQFLHVDPDRAAADGPFGGTVAHGFLTLAMLVPLAESALPVIDGLRYSVNIGFDRVRFVAPVRAGARIRGRFTLRETRQRRPGEVDLHWSVTVEIEGEDSPAIVALWIGRHYLAPEEELETRQ